MLVALYATLVVVLSVIPAGGPELGHLDKLGHLCEYLVFSWLLVQAMRASRPVEGPSLFVAWLCAASFGWLMELVQALLPWRSADWADGLMDALGAAVGVWVGYRFARGLRGSGV